MSSASSSGASLARSQSHGSSTRRPRPRSPPSMYVAYESSIAKPPKPLLKLDKKTRKGSAKQSSPMPDLLDPFPAQKYRSTSTPTASAPLQPRPSTRPFFSLRRKTISHAPPSISPPGRIMVSVRNQSPGASHGTPHSSLHEANVHPVDNVRPLLCQSSKDARLLGDAPGSQISEADGKAVGADFSLVSPRSSGIDAEASSEGRSSFDESVEDAWHREDSNIQRESTVRAHMEFTSPCPQSAVTRRVESFDSDTASGDEDDEGVEPITPIASLPPSTPPDRCSRTESESNSRHSRHSSLIQEPPRPEIPFLDTLVTVDSQVLITQNAPRHTHAHKPCVIRAETKEGWIGEWNQEDMQDVIHKLRSLKFTVFAIFFWPTLHWVLDSSLHKYYVCVTYSTKAQASHAELKLMSSNALAQQSGLSTYSVQLPQARSPPTASEFPSSWYRFRSRSTKRNVKKPINTRSYMKH
ncbi:hypothetical protein B0H16DRAFT_1686879 [Mycena metata]|uniref:Uncharacterized protein n=1 Tax=Mycena metata TaxID=1033252 RepID=A0AAD7JPE1_9AGAR|nr:hypothetical protein B0H16DRAFT_1686879 [Mycena metata]